MQNLKNNIRIIKYYSIKNQKTMEVHSELARKYAEILEQRKNVQTYAVDYPLNCLSLPATQSVYLTGALLEKDWTSDFYICLTDGTVAIREIEPEMPSRLSGIKKLELSRRYWKVNGVEDWKIVVNAGTEG